MWSEGTLIGGRYVLLGRIGGGSMGEVWRAEDRVLERRVALKTVLPGRLDDEAFTLRFEREAKVLAALGHPGVVAVHDYGEHQFAPDEGGSRVAYLVMELVEGQSLHALRKELGLVPVPRALDLVAQACDALHAVHLRGIVHRDIKPSNLMLRGDGRVAVTDFGIANIGTGTRLTQTRQSLGTPTYMAPEQARGLPVVTPASDLYSLGVACYKLLSGAPPFTGATPVELAYKHLQDPVPELPGDIPGPVRAFVAKALAKNPEDRYDSAAVMAAAARRAADGRPMGGQPGGGEGGFGTGSGLEYWPAPGPAAGPGASGSPWPAPGPSVPGPSVPEPSVPEPSVPQPWTPETPETPKTPESGPGTPGPGTSGPSVPGTPAPEPSAPEAGTGRTGGGSRRAKGPAGPEAGRGGGGPATEAPRGKRQINVRVFAVGAVLVAGGSAVTFAPMPWDDGTSHVSGPATPSPAPEDGKSGGGGDDAEGTGPGQGWGASSLVRDRPIQGPERFSMLDIDGQNGAELMGVHKDNTFEFWWNDGPEKRLKIIKEGDNTYAPGPDTTEDDLHFGDIDGDGMPDCMAVGGDGRMAVHTAKMKADAGEKMCKTPHRNPAATTPGGDPLPTEDSARIQFADVTNDGKDDLLLTGESGETTVWASRATKPDKNHTTLGWAPPLKIVSPGAHRDIRFADLNGDGYAEPHLVTKDGSVRGWINEGPTATQVKNRDIGEIAAATHIPPRQIHLADIDGDHKADFLRIHPDGTVRAWLNTRERFPSS